MSIRTDFCIVGFPKCGTTAVARFLERSPHCHLAKLDDKYESPFFGQANIEPSEYYVSEKLNGHKYTAYAYSFAAIRKMLERNPETLFIFCVRDSHAALLSWWNMHRRIAKSGVPAGHFANRTKEDADFYANCSPSEHFERYSGSRLAYAERIDAVRRKFPAARLLVIRQEDLGRHPRSAMTRVHDALGVAASRDYLAKLKKSRRSFGSRASKNIDVSARIAAELDAYNDKLDSLMRELPAEQKYEPEASWWSKLSARLKF